MGVSIGGTHSNTWGLILVDLDISPPVVKTKYVSIDGRSGDIDISEVYGEPKYEDRTVTMKFILPGSINQDVISEIENTIHGQRCDIIFDHDPDYHYTGRVSVDHSQKDQKHAEVNITAKCEPWRYKTDITEKTFLIAKNLVRHSDFDSIENWTPTGCALSVDSNVMSLTGTEDSQHASQSILGHENDHIYYARAFVMTEETNCSYLSLMRGTVESRKTSPTADTWYELGVYGTTEYTFLQIGAVYSTTPAGTRVMKVKKALCIDLTAIYGAGNEPSRSAVEGYLAEFGDKYFEHANLTDLQETVVLTNARQTAYPIISIGYGTFNITLNNITYSYSAGMYQQSIIPLLFGSNTLDIEGNGSIAFQYQEGSL